jgi:hypothetical protein
MAVISGSEQVYRTLVEESNESWLYGLLAFAIIEEKRIEWMQHFQANNGRSPDTDDIKHWYEQQPEGEILRAKGEAENSLKAYADEIWQVFLADEQKKISESLVVSEIRSIRRFWPQFGINVAGGMVSAFVFAAILAVLAFVVWQNPSPIDLGRDMMNGSAQEVPDGETSAQ